jgi:SAM-dependent methyltransferase
MAFYSHEEHYSELVLRQVPEGSTTALDVGCGDGRFTVRLAGRGLENVVGVDPATEVLPLNEQAEVRWVNADFLAHDFHDERFDFVMSMASIHHMPLKPALERMRDLLKPAGRIAVLGLYRKATPTDRALDLPAAAVNTYLSVRRQTSPTPAPKVAPETSLAEVRDQADAVLPGVHVRRLLLWRYLLTWSAPAAVT